uniref:Uncharacterized protein n=1 Tax=Cacopsylla melanoneura TaxID=428564 RepID=A0A8D8PRB0_9HEMI
MFTTDFFLTLQVFDPRRSSQNESEGENTYMFEAPDFHEALQKHQEHIQKNTSKDDTTSNDPVVVVIGMHDVENDDGGVDDGNTVLTTKEQEKEKSTGGCQLRLKRTPGKHTVPTN